jgi:predicted nucleic acid-binding protein
MAVTSWLIDKSAYVRLQLGQAGNRDEWSARISRRLVRLSTITRLELGYSTRSGDAGREQFNSPPLSLMPIEHLTPAIEDRAFEVQMLLADRGQHRAPSIPDLLIAATAEKAMLTVLAVDKDFDLIAAITGQPVETLELDHRP